LAGLLIEALKLPDLAKYLETPLGNISRQRRADGTFASPAAAAAAESADAAAAAAAAASAATAVSSADPTSEASPAGAAKTRKGGKKSSSSTSSSSSTEPGSKRGKSAKPSHSFAATGARELADLLPYIVELAQATLDSKSDWSRNQYDCRVPWLLKPYAFSPPPNYNSCYTEAPHFPWKLIEDSYLIERTALEHFTKRMSRRWPEYTDEERADKQGHLPEAGVQSGFWA
jgi:hypothetical protein